LYLCMYPNGRSLTSSEPIQYTRSSFHLRFPLPASRFSYALLSVRHVAGPPLPN
jgi:hypothetical protein